MKHSIFLEKKKNMFVFWKGREECPSTLEKFSGKEEDCPSTLEKAMAPHSSTLAWKIPWTKEPDRLQSMGLLGVKNNWVTSLSLFIHALEKEMATHSSVLAWRIPGTGEPGGLPSMGSQSRTWLKWLSSSSSSPSTLERFSGSITQHFYLYLISQNLVTWFREI